MVCTSDSDGQARLPVPLPLVDTSPSAREVTEGHGTPDRDPNFALIVAGVIVIIIYGSLFPFQFHHNSGSSGPLRALIDTWRTPTGRGDLIANLLLYFPLGLFAVQSLRRMPTATRLLAVVFAGSALSVSMELTQFYVVGRVSALADVYANAAGTLLGAAASTILFRKLPWARTDTADRRPFLILLLSCWLGYRLFPYAPTIDLHKYWTAVKPLIFSPSLPPLDLYRHTVIWLVAALLIEALLGTARSRVALLLLFLAVLLARILIIDAVLSPSEVLGGVIAIPVWSAFLSRMRIGALLVAMSFVGVVVAQALEPFQFSTPARPFEWIPFYGFMQGSIAVNVRSFLEKAFSYGALIWLMTRAGCTLVVATGLGGTLVLGLRLAQMFLPGRSAEITDLIILLSLAVVMKVMGEDSVSRTTQPRSLNSWWHSSLLRVYESLTRNDPAQPADLIFVLAGRMERKLYGLELYRAGVSPRLVLSVGRFEVSKMSRLGLEGADELIALREKTQPEERNFLVKMDSSGRRIERARLARCSTYGEALALRRLLETESTRTVMVISTDVHLRRVAMTFASVFHDATVDFRYCPVPSRYGFLAKDGWWIRPDDRRFVVKELLKLVGYKVILCTPVWARRRLMRLRDHREHADSIADRPTGKL